MDKAMHEYINGLVDIRYRLHRSSNKMVPPSMGDVPLYDAGYLKTNARHDCKHCKGRGLVGMVVYHSQDLMDANERVLRQASAYFGKPFADLHEKEQVLAVMTFGAVSHREPPKMPRGTERNAPCDSCGRKRKKCSCGLAPTPADSILFEPCSCVRRANERRVARLKASSKRHSDRISSDD